MWIKRVAHKRSRKHSERIRWPINLIHIAIYLPFMRAQKKNYFQLFQMRSFAFLYSHAHTTNTHVPRWQFSVRFIYLFFHWKMHIAHYRLRANMLKLNTKQYTIRSANIEPFPVKWPMTAARFGVEWPISISNPFDIYLIRF